MELCCFGLDTNNNEVFVIKGAVSSDGSTGGGGGGGEGW